MRRTTTHLRAIVVAAVCLAGCSDPAPTGDVEEAETLQIVGTDSLAWQTSDLGVAAGTIDITLVCDGAVGHALAIEGVEDGTDLAVCTEGSASTATVNLATGTFTFFCTVPGHREAGMEGTINAT